VDVPDPLDGSRLAITHDFPRRLVPHATPWAEVPAQGATGAHLDELGQVVLTYAYGVGRAGGNAHAALYAAIGVYDGLLEVPEPDLSGSLLDTVHQLPDVEAGHG
jgi:hypothetical protein